MSYIRMKENVQIEQPPLLNAKGEVAKARQPIELPAGEVVSVAESVAALLVGRGQAEALPADFDPRKPELASGDAAVAAMNSLERAARRNR